MRDSANGSRKRGRVLVSVIMGSTSDWETMEHAAKTLEALGVAFETRVVSAHRTPLMGPKVDGLGLGRRAPLCRVGLIDTHAESRPLRATHRRFEMSQHLVKWNPPAIAPLAIGAD